MSWNPFWWSLQAALNEQTDNFFRQHMQEPKLPPPGTTMDPKTGAYVPAKREYTVARSTRAMPERKART